MIGIWQTHNLIYKARTAKNEELWRGAAIELNHFFDWSKSSTQVTIALARRFFRFAPSLPTLKKYDTMFQIFSFEQLSLLAHSHNLNNEGCGIDQNKSSDIKTIHSKFWKKPIRLQKAMDFVPNYHPGGATSTSGGTATVRAFIWAPTMSLRFGSGLEDLVHEAFTTSQY